MLDTVSLEREHYLKYPSTFRPSFNDLHLSQYSSLGFSLESPPTQTPIHQKGIVLYSARSLEESASKHQEVFTVEALSC